MLSTRGKRAIAPALPYWSRFSLGIEAGLYDPLSNPAGYVLLAVAENKSAELSAAALAKLVESRGSVDASTLGYDNMCGRGRFRAAFAAVMSRCVLDGARVNPDQLVVSSGCGALIMQLTMLLCDAGDAVLLPTPTYPALYNDVGTLPGACIVDVVLNSATDYRLTCDALEAAAVSSSEAGHPPRVLLLLNPNNPTGTILSDEELALALAFTRERGMHLIVDEIYANSCFDDERARFTSVTKLLNNQLGDDVHVLWGMSKDWGMSGMRVGCLYTHNDNLLKALSNVNYFTTVSNDTQDCLAEMLSDDAWVDSFLHANRVMLRDTYVEVTQALTAAAIPFTPARGGMFVWIDLSKWLPLGHDSGESNLGPLSLNAASHFLKVRLVSAFHPLLRLGRGGGAHGHAL